MTIALSRPAAWQNSRTHRNAMDRAATVAAAREEKQQRDEARRLLLEAARLRRSIKRDVIYVGGIGGPSTFYAFVGSFCREIGISKSEITTQHRAKRITLTRHVTYWIGVRRFYRSYPAIGKMLDRDHTSIIHGVRRIDALIEANGLQVASDPMPAALYLNRELGGVQ